MNNEEIKSQIRELKRKKNAVILAHNYQTAEIYDVADFVGDSFELACLATQTEASIIVLAGVRFMAESVKILSPTKKVLLPDLAAGCTLANFADTEKVREKKKEFSNAAVVAYVNSTASVKAEADICVTSANAVEICRKIENDEILFLPDRNLGSVVAENLPEKKIILWEGFCEVHEKILETKILAAKNEQPYAKILAHPECPPKIRELAEEVLGTSEMSRFVANSDANEFLIVTEDGMLEKLRRENPTKKFLGVGAICHEMKKITLVKILESLEKEQFEIKIDNKIASAARRSLQKMIDLTEK